MLANASGLAALFINTAFAKAAAPHVLTARRDVIIEITPNGAQPSTKGSAEYFTGIVRIDPLFQAPEPARGRGAGVIFELGARTAWHTHPLSQTLIVTSGVGRAQHWGGPVEEISQ
jgi:quercetin dioxygenase-like cupin family protein